jgi:hypothetical protein
MSTTQFAQGLSELMKVGQSANGANVLGRSPVALPSLDDRRRPVRARDSGRAYPRCQTQRRAPNDRNGVRVVPATQKTSFRAGRKQGRSHALSAEGTGLGFARHPGKPATAARATWMSSSTLPPLAPTAPITTPSTSIGIPPPKITTLDPFVVLRPKPG